MNVSEVVKKTIEERGVKQKWVVEQMNNVIPDINMNSQKLSAVTKGQRQFKCDELIAFCKAMKSNSSVLVPYCDKCPGISGKSSLCTTLRLRK